MGCAAAHPFELFQKNLAKSGILMDPLMSMSTEYDML